MTRTDAAATARPRRVSVAERCGSCGAPRATTAPPQPRRADEQIVAGTHCEWCGAEHEAPAEDRA